MMRWIALLALVIPLTYIWLRVWYDTRKSIKYDKELRERWKNGLP